MGQSKSRLRSVALTLLGWSQLAVYSSSSHTLLLGQSHIVTPTAQGPKPLHPTKNGYTPSPVKDALDGLLVVFGSLSSDVEATTVGIAVVDAPRVMVDKRPRTRKHRHRPTLEVASRVGAAGDLGVSCFTAVAGVVRIWCGVRSGICVHQRHGRDVRALGDAG